MRPSAAWLFLAVALLGVLVWRESDRPWLVHLDQRFHAWIISNSPAPQKWDRQVLLVEIDDSAMNAQPNWPWGTLDYALFLRLAEPRQPAAIGIVPFIPEGGSSESAVYDGLLEDLMIRAPRLAVNAAISPRPDRLVPDDGGVPLPVLTNVEGLTTGMPDFSSVAEASAGRYHTLVPVGATHIATPSLHEDCVPLAYRYSGSIVPSLVSQVARMALNVPEQDLELVAGKKFSFGEKLTLPVDAAGTVVADWRTLATVKRIPYFDLLVAARQGGQPGQEALLEQLRGRVVLLGRTDAESRVRLDSYGRPVSEAEYHAMALAMVLNHAFVRKAPAWTPLAVIAAGLLLVLAVNSMSRFHAWLLLPVTAVLYLALAVGLFTREGIPLPGVLAGAMLLLAFFCSLIKRNS